MSKKKQEIDPAEEYLDALRPIGEKTPLTRDLIKKVEKKQTKMPSGKNANKGKFTLGFLVCYGLFKEKKDREILIEYGDKLKKYTNRYAMQIPAEKAKAQAKFVQKTLDEIFPKKNTRKRE